MSKANLRLNVFGCGNYYKEPSKKLNFFISESKIYKPSNQKIVDTDFKKVKRHNLTEI